MGPPQRPSPPPRTLVEQWEAPAQAGPALPLVGVGGIDGPQAAWERITAGASLVQIYTGWIYEGPILVPEILEGLVQQLERHGLATLAEAVGSGLPWRSAP